MKTSWQYKGCYKDKTEPNRSFPIRAKKMGVFMTHADCQKIAEAAGSKYFALQNYYGDRNTNTGTCWHGNSYKDYGKASNCVKSKNGQMIGAGFSNSIYEKPTAAPAPAPAPAPTPKTKTPTTSTPTPVTPEPEIKTPIPVIPEPEIKTPTPVIPEPEIKTPTISAPTPAPTKTEKSEANGTVFVIIGVAAVVGLVLLIAAVLLFMKLRK